MTRAEAHLPLLLLLLSSTGAAEWSAPMEGPWASCTSTSGACDEAHETAGCAWPGCCEIVCEFDAACCEVQWDEFCVKIALMGCEEPHGCILATGACDEIHDEPGCADDSCCGLVCGVDTFCCEGTWDGLCVAEAQALCAWPIIPFEITAAISENEPCGEATNDGPGLVEFAAEMLAFDEHRTGNLFAVGVRDADWYEVRVPAAQRASWFVRSRFPLELCVQRRVAEHAFDVKHVDYALPGQWHRVDVELEKGVSWLVVAPGTAQSAAFSGLPCHGHVPEGQTWLGGAYELILLPLP